MTGRVEGKVAFITGAARGQGRAHAVRLAQEGADIIAIDICKPIAGFLMPPSTPEDLAKTADLLRATIAASSPPKSTCVTTRPESRSGHAVQQLGRLDVIVANAGSATPATRWIKPANETGRTRSSLPVGVEDRRPGAPYIGGRPRGFDRADELGQRVQSLCLSPSRSLRGRQARRRGLMWTFAVELGQHIIRVNSVHPTHVNTPMVMNEGAYKMVRPDLDNPGPNDVAATFYTSHTLPIPWVEPEDISNAVLFFASDESRYITGVTLPIDAGSCLK